MLFKSYSQTHVQMKYVKGKIYMKENCMLSFSNVQIVKRLKRF